MELRLIRYEFGEDTTLGELLVNGVHECYTLEDKDRGLTADMYLENIKQIKVYGKTAIPLGKYRVVKTLWVKHDRFTPYLLKVPGFEGIRIHSGVTHNDSLGCPLVGEKVFNNALQNTKAARIALDEKIFAALDAGEDVWISVEHKVKQLTTGGGNNQIQDPSLITSG